MVARARELSSVRSGRAMRNRESVIITVVASTGATSRSASRAAAANSSVEKRSPWAMMASSVRGVSCRSREIPCSSCLMSSR